MFIGTRRSPHAGSRPSATSKSGSFMCSRALEKFCMTKGEMYERVDRSSSVKRAHEMALKVDVDNQRRQGQLQGKTVHWVLRMFATILGMIETDVHLCTRCGRVRC